MAMKKRLILDKFMEEKHKACSICGLAKKQIDFYGNDSRCKSCKILYNKERRHIKNDQLKKYREIAENSYNQR